MAYPTITFYCTDSYMDLIERITFHLVRSPIKSNLNAAFQCTSHLYLMQDDFRKRNVFGYLSESSTPKGMFKAKRD